MPQQQQPSPSDKRPLLERKTPLGLSVALLILFAFFFVMPSAFRSARLSLKKKENDVKDWLPSDFVETSELEWFADHFAGESFVVATWPGCTEKDQRLKLLESKLRHECATSDPAAGVDDPELAADLRSAKDYGVRLGLLPASRRYDNWGGAHEKWLADGEGRWFFIKPDGRLYRWEEQSNGPAGLIRSLRRAMGSYQLEGTFVAAFGDQDKAEGTNNFYNDPTLVCAPMFRTVETGASLAAELAKEGGPLWPVDLTDQSKRPEVARRRAIQRLTGSLFAPAVPADFDWTPQAFRSVVSAAERDAIPENFDSIVEQTLTGFAEERLDGDRSLLPDAMQEVQTEAWYAVFDAAELQPPPRQTALLITLTEAAKDNLSYALGRGVMGGPRGRLLELAEESGVQPAAAPSMAPPPFNRPEVESIAGTPPLRLGGPPYDNVSIDEEGTVTLVRLVGYSILVGVVLSYLCFGSVKITIMVFIVGGSAAMLSMAVVNWTGGNVDAVLMSMPSLVYVLGLSGAIHVINYYRDEVRKQGRRGAAERALRHAFFPCTLAATTTAIGLASLYTSNLAPISNFGIYSAIGVIATLAILFTYLPAALQTFVTESPATSTYTPDQEEAQKETWLSDQWAATGRWICRHHVLVTSTCLGVLLVVGVGLIKIKTSVQLLKLFDSQSRIIRDYAWLEENFGKLVPMELVLRVPPAMQSHTMETSQDPSAESVDVTPQDVTSQDGDETQLADSQDRTASGPADSTGPHSPALNMLERVEAVSRINHVVHETLGEPGLNIVGTATSADTFLPPLPAVSNSFWNTRSLYNKELGKSREELLRNDYLSLEQEGPFAGSELWRISLRVDALSDVDYGAFIKTLRTAVEPVLRAYDTRDAMLEELVSLPEGTSAERVLIVGAERPKDLIETDLIAPRQSEDQPNEERIRTRSIYLSTLGELLRGESVKRPFWFDPHAADAPLEVGSDKWRKLLEQFDVTIWVDEQPPPQSAFTDADLVIDGTDIFSKPIEHRLVGDQIPDAAGSGALQVVYTGVVPVVYKAQRTLLASLVRSIAMAFVSIALVMMVLLNPARKPLRMLRGSNLGPGVMAGIVSMIPNMFPVLLVFGAMGHLGRLVDIGTMMTASVAMGVAVDDTIHFLSWFRSYIDRGYDRLKAVEMTYRRVGPAMTQTTIVGGVGLFVFALSTFTPTQRFGTLMLVLLAAALVGDLILLPALLAGSLGRFFKPRDGAGESADSPVPDSEQSIESTDAQDPPDDPNDPDPVIDKDALPQLRLHAPSTRADRPHRMKRR
ncbi:MMPL family transporter [Roseiconus nitratireducens]|uniref:MMPL family transporter n=1 Tax=Roseiconus nitratireducens TaxID=2605748 RepID=A0A5M6D1T8_9BACT|nr:MMPL family transporter [Roseiconus nitratireducens]KAA5541418.1 MMPL family transporter [Roseiconus nitratireducens]